MNTQALVENTDTNVTAMQREQSPQGIAPLAQLIASGSVSPEQVEKMMELQERWEANEARKAYFADISAARADMPMIGKNRKNDHLRTSYADLDSMIAGAGPVLGRHNLSFNFEYDQSVAGEVSTYCITTHAMGHTQRVKVTMPVMQPITSKAGNAATNSSQMVGIAMTYGRRYAFAAAFGIATGDDNDGNIPQSAPAVDMLDESDMAKLKAVCDEVGKDYSKYLDWMSTKMPLFNGVLQAEKSCLLDMVAQLRKSAKKAEPSKDAVEKETSK